VDDLHILEGEVIMAKETMTSKERLESAIHLEKPDRVPVVPSLLIAAASHLAGRGPCADLCGCKFSDRHHIQDVR